MRKINNISSAVKEGRGERFLHRGGEKPAENSFSGRANEGGGKGKGV